MFQLKSLLGLVGADLAIDLGTTNTRVFVKDRGVVIDEPSLVARNARTNGFEAFGREAHEMLGRTPANIESIRPLEEGVIAHFEAAQAMIEHFIKKAHGRSRLVSPRIVIGIPSGITQAQKRNLRDAVLGAKAAEVHFVEEAMAAAIGSGLPIEDPSGNVIVDVGGGTTDIAVISMAGIVWSASIRVAGNAMDEAIAGWVRKQHNLLVGERTAEHIKLRIGSAWPLDEAQSCELSGRDLGEGVPRTIAISDDEIREALAPCVMQVVDLVRAALQNTPPELSSDIVDRGIILTGGGSLLTHLDKHLRENTQLPVSYAEDPVKAAVIGLGRLMQDEELLKKVEIE